MWLLEANRRPDSAGAPSSKPEKTRPWKLCRASSLALPAPARSTSVRELMTSTRATWSRVAATTKAASASCSLVRSLNSRSMRSRLSPYSRTDFSTACSAQFSSTATHAALAAM